MKYYTQFLVRYGPNEEIRELLGSDGVFVLDGRNHLGTMIRDSMERIEKLKNVQPSIVGFSIRKGSRFCDGTEIHRWIIR